MQGLPKFYATKADLDNVRTDFGDDTYKAELQKLYDGRLIWVTVMDVDGTPHTVASLEDGITDATHKVVESGLLNEEQGIYLPAFVQMELIVDTNAYIYKRLGYTDDEITKELGA